MADFVASIIAIAGLAYKSSQTLYELITAIREAPATLRNLLDELNTVRHILQSLQTTLDKTNDAALPAGLRTCFEDLSPSMRSLKDACDAFADRLKKVAPNLSEGRMSWTDKVRLQFQEKEIGVFQYRLASHKSTLNIALTLASCKLSNENREATQDLENMILTATSTISGQIQGLEMGMLSLSIATATEPDDSVVKMLESHEMALQQCLKTCVSAMDAADKGTGLRIRQLEAMDSARQVAVGTIGTVTGRQGSMTVGHASSRQQAQQIIVGAIGSDSSKAVFHGFWQSAPASGSTS